MKATFQILLYTERLKQNGKYPLKIRLIYQREHRDIKLGMDLTETEFTEATKLKPGKKYRKIAADIIKHKSNANQIIEGLGNFTFDKFESAFFGYHKDASDIFPFFDEYIQNLRDEERIKTADAYQTAMNSIKKFYGKKKLSLYDITPAFLNKFQRWMIDQEKSFTTVGIYLRTLRTIYNYCINLGIVKRDENYPFVRNKYTIPAGRSIKKALTLPEIKKIYDYEPIPGSFEDRSKDFWMFSYFCSGINFKDIVMLKRKNIDGDMIRFIREKTKRSSQGNQVTISCYITNEMKHIIQKWGGDDTNKESYLFPILSPDDTLKRQLVKKDQFIQCTNKNMKRICKKIKMEKEVTTYYGRHSAATVLKRSGASIGQIQEALGHASSKTTENYLASFEDETKKELAIALSNF